MGPLSYKSKIYLFIFKLIDTVLMEFFGCSSANVGIEKCVVFNTWVVILSSQIQQQYNFRDRR